MVSGEVEDRTAAAGETASAATDGDAWEEVDGSVVE